MKIKSIGSNKTELQIKHTILLISYETPVALRYTNTPGVLKTSEFFSSTTSKHINTWLREHGHDPDKVPTQDQEFFDQFLKDNE